MTYETLSRRRLWAPSQKQDLAGCPAAIVEARDVMTQFASRQLGLSLGPRRWDSRIEVMDVRTPEGWQRAGPLAVLDPVQAPGAILGVELENPRQFTAWIMRDWPDAAEPGRARCGNRRRRLYCPQTRNSSSRFWKSCWRRG